ncbi:uncharacterized protein C3orf84 homolog isoform X2 [Pseudophryne corroboree]|uniref:uncharacterized protein C3orf84 homolog isoform X2 n=1 Tax=Pseudophryne corroboree TaxID=495146 RepID=UPI0030820F79
MPEAITGSWFPSGFHGHFRSHFRNDISQDYRLEAKPRPPTAFTQRMKGLGKKKLLKNRESHNFTQWIPLEEEMRRQRPIISTYRTDFWTLDEKTGKVPQLLVPRLHRATSASYSGLTTYRHMLGSHGSLPAPQKPSTTVIPIIYHSNREGAAGPSLQRAMSAPYKRLTVSDCLVWRSPDSTGQLSLHSIETS